MSIDCTNRYDIYCAQGTCLVVYRNVLFKSRRNLFKSGDYDVLADFLEIEHEDGARAFISRTTIFRFCEHGTGLTGEIVK